MATNKTKTEKQQIDLLLKAAKAGRSGLSADESIELEQLLETQPDMNATLSALALDLADGVEDDCIEKSLRVLFESGTPADEAEVASWQQASARHWRNHQRLRFILQVVNDSANLSLPETLQNAPMPQHLEQRFFEELAKSKPKSGAG